MTVNTGNEGEFGRREVSPALAPQPIVPKSAREALRPEPGTPPPRRSRRSRSQFVVFLNFLVSAVMLLVLAGGAAVYFGKRQFEGPGPATADTTFLVQPNTGVMEIARQLEGRGLISDARVFGLGVRAYGNDVALKAGEYEIAARASMRDIMEAMAGGKTVMNAITVPEGMTVEQALQRIASHQALTGDMPTTMPAEGSIVADTQRFTRGASRQSIIDKMTADQKKLVAEIWAKRAPDLPLEDVNDFVTLASIVEKETGRGDERARVAAVFVNRLKQGMRLQSDPTIIYGLFGGKGKPADRPIYQSDIDKETPYNTYRIDGLPPAPIANPGRAALEATANPAQTNELYFVADGSGGHVFASTLEEHNRNVERWRALEKQKAATGGAAPSGAGTRPGTSDASASGQ